jgi:peptidase M28-like protein
MTALLLLAPLLLLALTVGRPGPYPASALPPGFDGASATGLATELARDFPDREPGSSGATGAADWVEQKLGLYGLTASEDAWEQSIPGLGRVRLRNLVTVVPGATADAILILAHRDNTGVGPGANDNASGTAALIELARGYGRLGTVAGRPTPMHTLLFLSSDGGAYGGYGAERFASTSPYRNRLRAVVSLDGLAGSAEPRLELAGFEPRSPTPALLRTADARVAEQLGRPPARPDWLVQLVDLAVPFGYGEQAPFLARKISAVRLATEADGSADEASDTAANLNPARFASLGRAADAILSSLDGGIELVGGTAPHVYLGSRVVRGWSIELLLLTALVPFLAAAIDLFARCRRRRLALAGSWRALRTRIGVWLWIGLLVGLGALVGIFPRGEALPPAPGSPTASDWPVAGLLGLAALAVLGWLRARRKLLPVAAASGDEALAGYAVSLLALGIVAVATAFVSPFALVFVLPSLYAWLWLPQLERSPGWVRDVLFGLGFAGPALALVVIGTQLSLGLDTPLYVVSLMTLGLISWPSVLALLLWAAVATQFGALVSGRFRVVPRSPGRVHRRTTSKKVRTV